MRTDPFWTTLVKAQREELFALMCELGSEADQHFKRGRDLEGPPGTIPVGSAMFDETLQGAVREEFVRALRTAPTLEAAEQTAADAVRLWVRRHNARRPKDVNWQRWTEAGQADLEGIVRRVREIL